MNLEKTYEPSSFEEKIYQLWEKSGAFSPKHRGSDQYYSVVMPPPNANANLHIGYELTAALEAFTSVNQTFIPHFFKGIVGLRNYFFV